MGIVTVCGLLLTGFIIGLIVGFFIHCALSYSSLRDLHNRTLQLESDLQFLTDEISDTMKENN